MMIKRDSRILVMRKIRESLSFPVFYDLAATLLSKKLF